MGSQQLALAGTDNQLKQPVIKLFLTEAFHRPVEGRADPPIAADALAASASGLRFCTQLANQPRRRTMGTWLQQLRPTWIQGQGHTCNLQALESAGRRRKQKGD